jgi:peptidoglycan/LPS O-acetylase OafA/YrhL
MPTGRDNNFDVLRLVAAAMVLVSHSFVLTGGEEPHLGGLALGTFGVVVFFAISGFLVCRSWTFQPRLWSFAAKRALRIVPALAVTVFVCAYVLGPIATGLAPSSYFTSAQPFEYVAGNLLSVVTGELTGGPVYELPGVFADNPYGPAVNGSLWTLPIEVQAYAAVAALGLLGALTRGLPLVAGGALVLTATHEAGVSLPVVSRLAEAKPASVLLLGTFAVAGLLWIWRERIPLRADAALVALAIWVASFGTAVEGALTMVLMPYVVLAAAYLTPAALRIATRYGDVSYGVYLLAFPVQQSLLAVWPGASPAALIALSLPITYALAHVSWRLVESPALRLKPAIARRRLSVAKPQPAAPQPAAPQPAPRRALP